MKNGTLGNDYFYGIVITIMGEGFVEHRVEGQTNGQDILGKAAQESVVVPLAATETISKTVKCQTGNEHGGNLFQQNMSRNVLPNG